MTTNKILDNVLDLPGVDGVCLFDLSGTVFVNRMPSFLTVDLMGDALRRISSLYDTMDENFLPCDDYLLRFAEKWLLFRRTDQVVLLVMAAESANFASTRMVTNMALKHLTPAVLQEMAAASKSNSITESRPPQVEVAQPPTPVASPVASAPVAAPVAESVAAKPIRMYRGKAY